MATSTKHQVKRSVQHDYHDHAAVPFPSLIYAYLQRHGDGGGGEQHNEGPRGGVVVQFPVRLHAMLSRVEDDGAARIISWQPHGRCFKLHQPKRFESEILPAFFHHKKLTSFQRQLNLYGFSRITTGKDKGAYYHELFLRHRLFLSLRMSRTKIKGVGVKGKASPETEPDFYAMPRCAPQDGTVPPALLRALDREVAAVIRQEDRRLRGRPSPPNLVVPSPAAADSSKAAGALERECTIGALMAILESECKGRGATREPPSDCGVRMVFDRPFYCIDDPLEEDAPATTTTTRSTVIDAPSFDSGDDAAACTLDPARPRPLGELLQLSRSSSSSSLDRGDAVGPMDAGHGSFLME